MGLRCTGTGYKLGPLWAALWVPRGLPTWDPAHLATCFTKVPIGLAYVWAERGSHMGLMCYPFFKCTVGGPELGTSWVLCGPLMGGPHGTQLILATSVG